MLRHGFSEFGEISGRARDEWLPVGTKLRAELVGWSHLVMVLSGSLDVSIRGALWQFRAGQAFWMPGTGWDSAVSWEETRVLCLGSDQVLFLEPRWVEGSDFLRELLSRMVGLGFLGDHELGRSLLRVLANEVSQSWSTALAPRWPRSYWADKVATALAQVGPEEASMVEIARQSGMSRRTLDRQFAHETGLGPSEWRREARLCESIRLLSMGMHTGEAGRLVGYGNRTAYIKAFQGKFGMSPARFWRAFGPERRK